MAKVIWQIYVVIFFTLTKEIITQQCAGKTEYPSGDRIIIKNIQSKDEFKCVTDGIRYNQKQIWDIRNLNLKNDTLPRGAFKETNLQKLILRDFYLSNLSEDYEKTKPPFEGLENTLKELIIINPLNGVKWEWEELSQLNKIEKFVISHGAFAQGPISKLDQSKFKKLNGSLVKWFQMTGSCTSDLGNDLLQSFTSLKYLHLQGNKLTTFNRESLPEKVRYLEYIDLSNNKINWLHKTTFERMPALKVISLTNNLIETLWKSAFKPPLRSTRKMYLYDNNIICDSNIDWLIKDNKTISLFEDDHRPLLCSQPDSTLKGKAIKSLKLNELSYLPKKTASPILMLPANYLPLHVCEPNSFFNNFNRSFSD